MPQHGRYPKGDAKRAEILDNALTVFARAGYRATSLRQVAQESNISLGGLMHYFDSKEHMLTEVLRRRDEFDTTASAIPAGDVLGSLPKIMTRNMSGPGLVELYLTLAAASADPTHPAHDFFRARFERIRNAIIADIRAGQAAGRIASDIDATTAARNIIAAADGIQAQWLTDRDVDMGAQVSEAIARFLPPPATSR